MRKTIEAFFAKTSLVKNKNFQQRKKIVYNMAGQTVKILIVNLDFREKLYIYEIFVKNASNALVYKKNQMWVPKFKLIFQRLDL